MAAKKPAKKIVTPPTNPTGQEFVLIWFSSTFNLVVRWPTDKPEEARAWAIQQMAQQIADGEMEASDFVRIMDDLADEPIMTLAPYQNFLLSED